MKIQFICTLFLLTFIELSASALDSYKEELVVHSDDADYDGGTIVLNGHVSVDHELGKITADKVMLIRPPEQKKIKFPEIKMYGDVLLDLSDGASLKCDNAHLSYLTKSGVFYSGDQQEFVVYSDLCREKNNECAPFVVQSRQMNVALLSDDTVKPSRSYISDIVAENTVTVVYKNNFKADADKATYHRLAGSSEHAAKRLEGIIHLQANGEEGQCQISNNNGDSVQAREIRIDTLDRSLAFIYPVGKINVSQNDGPDDYIYFTSDTMTWDEKQDILTMRENIHFDQKGMGEMRNDEEVKVFQKTDGNKKQLHKVQATGKTVLIYNDDKNETEHTLTSYGNSTIDHLICQTVLESPRDAQGKVLEGNQVHFQDKMGAIYADKFTMDYQVLNNNIVLKKIFLEGHVLIRNQFNLSPEEATPLLQYAMADNAEFFPQTQEMVLKANKNRRVLFFDKVNNIQVSAPALKIKRDPLTKKESIRGSGDVRFTLVEGEMEELRQHFNLKKDE